ncbi:hypothetical protein FBU59_000557 [Linderina macrospora]|uniref:Uncharacterized protein n=1 Tax=Linderina macrospora TaxID=4868 RepID=A0ACC1JGP7_9FUNG|nr:hypothetical protein FBU59_000557 [Linderina macrospora]
MNFSIGNVSTDSFLVLFKTSSTDPKATWKHLAPGQTIDYTVDPLLRHGYIVVASTRGWFAAAARGDSVYTIEEDKEIHCRHFVENGYFPMFIADFVANQNIYALKEMKVGLADIHNQIDLLNGKAPKVALDQTVPRLLRQPPHSMVSLTRRLSTLQCY